MSTSTLLATFAACLALPWVATAADSDQIKAVGDAYPLEAAVESDVLGLMAQDYVQVGSAPWKRMVEAAPTTSLQFMNGAAPSTTRPADSLARPGPRGWCVGVFVHARVMPKEVLGERLFVRTARALRGPRLYGRCTPSHCQARGESRAPRAFPGTAPGGRGGSRKDGKDRNERKIGKTVLIAHVAALCVLRCAQARRCG